MDVLSEKEKMMRDYWLNSLGSNHVERLETKWFSNDDDAELLEAVRADLIDDYITKNLSKTDYLQFEKYFLPNNLEDIVLAKSSIDISLGSFEEAKKKGLFEKFSQLFHTFASLPQIAFAVIFLACIGLIIGYFAKSYNKELQPIAQNNETEFENQNSNQANNIAENINTPIKNETNANIVKEPLISKSEPKTAKIKVGKDTNKPENRVPKIISEGKSVDEPKVAAKQQVLLLTSFRGSVKTLTVSNSTENFLLKLDMPGIDKVYKNYEMRIYDSNNNLVVKQSIKENLSLKKSGERINIPSLKANKFKKNDTYKTSLVGVDEKNEVTELCVYDNFKVN
jgi:hypothetical protein